MEHPSILFWNVDTQNDFVEPWGKLYVPGAETLKPKWESITRLAKKQKLRTVNTADYHYIHSPEIDDNPDMVHTFPPHCIADTKGARFVSETTPETPLIFNWNIVYDRMALEVELVKYRNVVVRKDAFDVFAGNPVTVPILEMLHPKVVVVYGVTTNVCVDFAVRGLAERVENVYVVEDAIKELPNLPLPFKKWKKLGVKLTTTEELINSFT